MSWAVRLANQFDFHIKQNKVCGSGDKKWEFAPALFGADAKPLPADKIIWTGSKVKAAFCPFTWFVKGELGVTLRLKGGATNVASY